MRSCGAAAFRAPRRLKYIAARVATRRGDSPAAFLSVEAEFPNLRPRHQQSRADRLPEKAIRSAVARKRILRALRTMTHAAVSPTRLRGLRPCRADAIAYSERKRNIKLQPVDDPRHLSGLNPEQRRAVGYGIGEHFAPPPALLIAAGAGTGKTKTLAHRAAYLILNGGDPQRLLLLTFTRRAALEMTRRSQQILAEARGNAAPGISTSSSLLPWSGTFHAIGSRPLRLHAGSIGLEPTFTVLDRANSADLFDLVRSELGLSQTGSRFPARTPAWRSTRTPSMPAVRSKKRSPRFSHGASSGRVNSVACFRPTSQKSNKTTFSITTISCCTGITRWPSLPPRPKSRDASITFSLTSTRTPTGFRPRS